MKRRAPGGRASTARGRPGRRRRATRAPASASQRPNRRRASCRSRNLRSCTSCAHDAVEARHGARAIIVGRVGRGGCRNHRPTDVEGQRKAEAIAQRRADEIDLSDQQPGQMESCEASGAWQARHTAGRSGRPPRAAAARRTPAASFPQWSMSPATLAKSTPSDHASAQVAAARASLRARPCPPTDRPTPSAYSIARCWRAGAHVSAAAAARHDFLAGARRRRPRRAAVDRPAYLSRWRPTSARTMGWCRGASSGIAGIARIVDVDGTAEPAGRCTGLARRRRRGGATVRGRLARPRRLRPVAAAGQRSARHARADPARPEAGRAAARLAARRRHDAASCARLGSPRRPRSAAAPRRALRPSPTCATWGRCCSAPASPCRSSIRKR